MLNAMPMPIGPTEIPSGSTKPEIQRKAPDHGAAGEGTNSFTSALEAVHKKSQSTGNDINHQTDDAPGALSISEDEGVADESEDCIVSAEEVFNLMAQDQAIPSQDLNYKTSTKHSEINTASEDTPLLSETELMDEAAGFLTNTMTTLNPNAPDLPKETVATPSSNRLDFVLPRQPAVVNADVQGEANGKETVPAMLIQEDANGSKTVTASGESGPAGLGQQVLQSAKDQSNTASQVMEGAPDRKLTPKAQLYAFEGWKEKAAEVDDTPIKPVLDEGEPKFSNKDQPTSHLQHKGSENRKTELTTSTPGKIKAQEVNFQTVRSQTAEDSGERLKLFADRAPETPINMMNDPASPLTGRQGAFDPTLSFSTLPVGEKVVAASGHITAVPTAAEIFPKENFHQLVERALFTVRGELSEARIALKPDHLGHVQMKIVTENNLVSIKIITESLMARDLIDSNANQLKADLQQQGLNVENIEVAVSDERHDAYRQARQRKSFAGHMTSQGHAPSEEDGDISDNEPAQVKNDRNSVSGIDYFA